MGLQKEEVNTQKQHDELDIHDCVHHLVEMVNAILLLLPQSPLTALNPQLVCHIIDRIQGIAGDSGDV